MRALVVALVIGGCTPAYYTSDVNAPGNVTLAPPPRENGSAALYVEPSDPGEHELYFAPGVAVGPVSGRRPDATEAGVELGTYLRLAYKTRAVSHRKDDTPYPLFGWAMVLGWSPLQTGDDVDIGPVFVEVERDAWALSAGLGLAVYPDDGTAGVQLTLSARPYGIRFRYMNDTGFEVVGAIQLELPRAYAWSR